MHFRFFLQRDLGKLNLKEVIMNLPMELGSGAFSGTSQEIILFGHAQPHQYVQSAYDQAYSQLKSKSEAEVMSLREENKSLKHEIMSIKEENLNLKDENLR